MFYLKNDVIALTRILDSEINSVLKDKTPQNTDFKYRGFNCNLSDQQRVDDIFRLKAVISTLKFGYYHENFCVLIYDKISKHYTQQSIYEINILKQLIEKLKDSSYFQFRLILIPIEDSTMLFKKMKYKDTLLKYLYACSDNSDENEKLIAKTNQKKFREKILNILSIKNIKPSIIDKTEPVKICESSMNFNILEFLKIHHISRYVYLEINDHSLNTLKNGQNLLINNDDIKLFLGIKFKKTKEFKSQNLETIKVYSDSLNIDEYGSFIVLDNIYSPIVLGNDINLEEVMASINFDPNCPETFTMFLEENDLDTLILQCGVFIKMSHQNIAVIIKKEKTND